MVFGRGINEGNSAGNNWHDKREIGELDGDEKAWDTLTLFRDRWTLLILPCCTLLFGSQAVGLPDCSIVQRWPEVAQPYLITLVNPHNNPSEAFPVLQMKIPRFRVVM